MKKFDFRLMPAFILSIFVFLYDIGTDNLRGAIIMGILALIWLGFIIFNPLKNT